MLAKAKGMTASTFTVAAGLPSFDVIQHANALQYQESKK